MVAATPDIIIPDYQITEQLYSSSKTKVYRAIRAKDSLAVIIKLLACEYPSFKELSQFRNQYTITKNLKLAGIVHPVSLETYGNGYILVMKDFGEISLPEYTQTHTLCLADFLAIAIQLSDILHSLHQSRVIHKDIKPANILIHPESKLVKLIDFSIASLLPKEAQEIKNPNVLEGSLAYLSPEQTGRMNRGIDYRSDFYSLGVTFYELLTGKLPFICDDLIELVHCHIAQQATPVSEVNLEIPEVISEIIDKLMAKNTEARYQSALGLKCDLETCLYQLKHTSTITYFEIGKQDLCDRFMIPEKLYGREVEVQTLLDAFDRAAKGKTEMMLVAGFSGIGKTSVVSEVHKPILQKRGYFIKGKFDQFNRNIPLGAFFQALRNLIEQLLAKSDVELQAWKSRILEALGENAQVLISVIPELEYIIGSQAPVQELSGIAAQNRFNLLFQKFIQLFMKPEHPLVVFLDDLQWADSASLKLMQLLMDESQGGYLLLIGAYRDNEVFAAHPLMLLLDEVKKAGTRVSNIILQNLSEYSLNQLVADTLNCAMPLAQPLTDLVYQKTKGNPFFATQFLKALHHDRLITFDVQAGYWLCDIIKVRDAALTADVVEFMATQLQKLPIETQEVLKLASCVGNQFNLGTLAIISQRSECDTANALWKGLEEGLIVPQSAVYKFYNTFDAIAVQENPPYTNENVVYRFLHDRIQQAAYSLIPEENKQITHYQIGKNLLEKLSRQQQKEQIFDIVNHLSIGINQLQTPTEQEELANLALLAGQKAKSATAYNAAVDYFDIALKLVGDKPWQQNYDINLKLHEQAAEAAYLSGQFTKMEQFICPVLEHGKAILDQVNVYEIKIQGQIAQNHLPEALETALSILKELGIEFPNTPTHDVARCHLEKFHADFCHYPIDELSNNTLHMQNQIHLAQSKIIFSVMSAAYQSASPLLVFLITKQIELSIQYGNTPISALMYIWYGVIVLGNLEDIDSSFKIGQLSLQLLSTLANQNLNAKIFNIAYAFNRVWKLPIRDSLQPLLEGYHSGIETGDLEYACYAAYNHCGLAYCAGVELESLKQKMQDYGTAIKQFKQQTALNFHRIFWQSVLNWLEISPNPSYLAGEVYDETQMLPLHQLSNDHYAICTLYINKLILAYGFEQYPQAQEYAGMAEEYASAVAGSFKLSLIFFYSSLALLTNYDCLNSSEQKALLERISANLAKLENWAIHAPSNHTHKVDLVKAELQRVCGNKVEALEYYDSAIAKAKENGYIQEEALANELTAKFYLSWGKQKVAAGYMQEAYFCYARWGAKAKIYHLEEYYPQLLGAIFQSTHLPSTNLSTMTKTVTSFSGSQNLLLDFAAVIKAAQAISQEIELDKLLATLMEITIANGGAQSGHFILCQGQKWLVFTQVDGNRITKIPLANYQEIPQSLIYTVARTQTMIAIENLSKSEQFAGDSYVVAHQPKSVLCTPINQQGQLIGILYLENNLTEGAFSCDRVEMLQILTSQIGISFENARLYQQIEQYSHTLETEVTRKTQALNQKAEDLEQTLKELRQTQAQLIHAEKMSSLGQLVAGIAHEINNPVNFIKGNLICTQSYVEDIMGLLTLYQQEYPQPSLQIQTRNEEIDLEFLYQDLTKLLESMSIGSDRISQIVLSLRNFSRLDESEIKTVDLHSGIESTLLLLRHRLLAVENQVEIEVVKEYGQIPNVTCYPSHLNQVFLNILNNAIDAMRDETEMLQKPQIFIRTEVMNNSQIQITFANTGNNIPANIQERIFEPFFTTKAIGRGAGLGLFVSYTIIKKHGGTLTVKSQPDQVTEFAIKIPIIADGARSN